MSYDSVLLKALIDAVDVARFDGDGIINTDDLAQPLAEAGLWLADGYDDPPRATVD